MTNNKYSHIPWQAISPNILHNKEAPNYPSVRGTGFFCQLPPYGYTFYVTARHCLQEYNNNIDLTSEILRIPYQQTSYEKEYEFIKFKNLLEAGDEDDYEDVLIYLIDDNIDSSKKLILKNRSLKLTHQDHVDYLLNFSLKNKENIRVIGYPNIDVLDSMISVDDINNLEYSRILYPEYDSNGNISGESKLILRARGFYGKINEKNSDIYYSTGDTNWRGNNKDGFSGSPVITFIPSLNEIITIPLGMMVMESRFININIITNIIAKGILANFKVNN